MAKYKITDRTEFQKSVDLFHITPNDGADFLTVFICGLLNAAGYWIGLFVTAAVCGVGFAWGASLL